MAERRITDWRVFLRTPEGLGLWSTRAAEGYRDLFGKTLQERLTPIPPEQLVSELRAAGVRAIITASDNETVWKWRVPPEHIADLCRRFPEDLIGFGGVDPYKGQQALRDVERAAKEFGFKGIDIQPWMHLLPINDRRYYPIYDLMQDLGLIAFIACSTHFNRYAPLDIQQPELLDRVAVDFPRLKIVDRHAGWPWILDVIAVAQRHRNVYLELSGIRPKYLHPDLLQAVRSQFQDRTLFGTGYPLLPFKETIDELNALPIPDAVKEKILYTNSERLLGLA